MSGQKTKRHKDNEGNEDNDDNGDNEDNENKKTKTKKIVTSGQFRTLAMFYMDVREPNFHPKCVFFWAKYLQISHIKRIWGPLNLS